MGADVGAGPVLDVTSSCRAWDVNEMPSNRRAMESEAMRPVPIRQPRDVRLISPHYA
jgi:hypothetical protein